MLDFKFEEKFNKLIIGVDEVGRGPFAGPVVAAACYFPNPKNKLIKTKLFNDSKKLSVKKREECFEHLLNLKKKYIVKFSIGKATVEEIDLLNILQASLLAIKRALYNISCKNTLVLIDGKHKPKLKNISCKNIIRGDQKSISIAAASIIAKIHRDNIMKKLSKSFPQYDWNHNMGYGTKKHINALKMNGITMHHRKSFKPIMKFIHNNY